MLRLHNVDSYGVQGAGREDATENDTTRRDADDHR